MYYKPDTKQTFASHSDIRAGIPYAMFPQVIDDGMLAYVGVFPLAQTPPATTASQIARPLEPQLIDGVWTQMWKVDDLTPEELAARAAAAAPTREQLKQARQAAVDAITVTVNGKVFDGDETSQGRMARALVAADAAGMTSCTWVLHDNTAATVTKADLAQALALAMQAQAAVWVLPA